MIAYLRAVWRAYRRRKRAIEVPLGRIISVTEDKQGIRYVWEPTDDTLERIRRWDGQ